MKYTDYYNVIIINTVHCFIYFLYFCNIVFPVDPPCFPYLFLSETHPLCLVTAHTLTSLSLPFIMLINILTHLCSSLAPLLSLNVTCPSLVLSIHVCQTRTAYHQSSTPPHRWQSTSEKLYY